MKYIRTAITRVLMIRDRWFRKQIEVRPMGSTKAHAVVHGGRTMRSVAATSSARRARKFAAGRFPSAPDPRQLLAPLREPPARRWRRRHATARAAPSPVHGCGAPPLRRALEHRCVIACCARALGQSVFSAAAGMRDVFTFSAWNKTAAAARPAVVAGTKAPRVASMHGNTAY
jgi:hypothetical protein